VKSVNAYVTAGILVSNESVVALRTAGESTSCQTIARCRLASS